MGKCGFLDGSVGKESACNAGNTGDVEFDSWVGKIPWRRKWQSTPVFLPEKSHRQRSLAGYSPRGHKEFHVTKRVSTLTCTHLIFDQQPFNGFKSRHFT